MRTRHAAVLSVVAVLTAGTAAAIVNTRALAGSGGHADIALSSVPTLNDATSTDGSTTTITAADTQRAFTIGDAGVMTLDRANGALVVTSVAPASGWQVAAVTHVSDSEVNVELTSSTARATVAAVESADGIVITITETTSAVTAPPQAPTGAPATTPSPVATPEPVHPTSATAVIPTTAKAIANPTASATTTTTRTTRTTMTTRTTNTTTTRTSDDDTPGAPGSEPDGDHGEPDD
ncbi:MAG: hypothetical protein ABIR68_10255 [Ilumatobacteraceae bacterium]